MSVKDWFCCHRSTGVINYELNYMGLEYVNVQVTHGHLQQLFFCPHTFSIYVQELRWDSWGLPRQGMLIPHYSRGRGALSPVNITSPAGVAELCRVSEVQSVPAVTPTSSLWHDWAKPSVCLVAHASWEAWGEARDLCSRARVQEYWREIKGVSDTYARAGGRYKCLNWHRALMLAKRCRTLLNCSVGVQTKHCAV